MLFSFIPNPSLHNYISIISKNIFITPTTLCCKKTHLFYIDIFSLKEERNLLEYPQYLVKFILDFSAN